MGQAGEGLSAEGVHVGVCSLWKGGTWLWPGHGGGAASRGWGGADAVVRRYLGQGRVWVGTVDVGTSPLPMWGTGLSLSPGRGAAWKSTLTSIPRWVCLVSR